MVRSANLCAYLVDLALLLAIPSTAVREIFDNTDDVDTTGNLSLVEQKEDQRVGACPHGLDFIREESGTAYCIYQNPQDTMYNPISPATQFRMKGSNESIRFNVDTFAFEGQLSFVAEYQAAVSDATLFNRTFSGFMGDEIAKDPNLTHQFNDWKSHWQPSDGIPEWQRNWNIFLHEMEPMWFIIEHGIEHGVLEVAVAALHAAEYYAKKQAMTALYESLKIGVKVLHGIGYYGLTPWVVIAFIRMVEIMHHEWLHIIELVWSSLFRLVLRPSCVKQRMIEDKPQIVMADLIPEVQQICGVKAADTLANAMQRVNLQLMHFFEVIASVGRCVWPMGKHNRAKIMCARRMNDNMREKHGKPGQLFTLLAWAETAMFALDDLLIDTRYGHIMEDKFGLGVTANVMGLRTQLEEVAQANASTRFLMCWNTLASMRGLELTVARMSRSMEVWVSSFGRRNMAMNWFANWLPCRKVFYKLEEAEEKGFCKYEEFTREHNGHLEDLEDLVDRVACSAEENYPAWHTHILSYRHSQAWCRTVQVYQGYEYRYFVNPEPGHGCQGCCKRPDVRNKLWPEIGGGGH